MKLPRFLKSKSSVYAETERNYTQGTHSHRSSVSRLSTRDLQLTSSHDYSSELQKTHTHILDQLRQARQLRQFKDPFLQSSEKAWIDGVLGDVTNVIRDVEVQRGAGNASLSIPNESRWRNRYDEQAKEELQRMTACQSTLSGVLNHLENLETPKPTMVHEMGINDVTLIHEMPAHEEVILKTKLEIDDGIEVYRPPKEPPLYSIRDSSGLQVASTFDLNSSSLSQEMSDMLAWRRSKGSRSSNHLKKPGLPDRIDV
ncbi:hypothetical protein N7488_004635 [Penicillium malachiteum]|nr:hypothetical protein N7488_004635 [Penicillium malachiteum]